MPTASAFGVAEPGSQALEPIESVELLPPPSIAGRVLDRLRPSRNRAVIAFIGFLIAWQLAAVYVIHNPLFFVGPIDVARGIRELWVGGYLWTDILVSAREFAIGFGISLVVGILLGLVLGTSDAIKGYVDPLLNAFYATPIIALAPLLILWFGIGDRKTILLVFLIAFLSIAINTDVGIRATDSQLLEAARSFGASRLQLFTMVRLPTSLPFVVAGIRIGIGRGLIGVVVGEFFGSQEGLGFRILLTSQFFQTAQLLAGVVIFAVTGMLLVLGMEALERRMAPWRQVN